MSPENSSAHSELIRAYRESVRSRAVSRRASTLLVMGVIFVFLGLLWAEFNDFRYRKMPEFMSALTTQASEMAPILSKDLMDLANRVYPYYTDVFYQMFQRDMPAFQKELDEQYKQLETFAQGEWPAIEQGIADLIITTEETSLAELNRIISPDDAVAVSHAYAGVIGEKLTDYFNTRLHKHVEVAKNIGSQLDQITHLEPDMNRPIELTEALGILLELSGIELQNGF